MSHRTHRSEDCSDAVVYLEGLADFYSCARTAKRKCSAYTCQVLIETVLMADMLRDGSQLREIVRRSCRILLSNVDYDVVEAQLATGGIPRKSAARRARSLFDFAFALAMRQHLLVADSPPILFGWADSSPMGGRNWLVSHLHIWRARTASEMRAVLAAAEELAAMPTVARVARRPARAALDEEGAFIRAGPAADNDRDAEEIEARKAALSHVVAQSFEYHCIIPGTLGTKAASVEHKCSTILHALRLEVPHAQDVEKLTSGMVALCTDMGTELALSEVSKSGFWKWFGREEAPARIHADTGDASFSEGDGEEGLEDGDAPDPPAPAAPDAIAADQKLFSQCIPIAGLLHILDNLLKNVHASSQWWKPFERLVRAVGEVLCKHAGIEQLTKSCVQGGPGQRHAKLFEKPYPMFIEWRWSSVVKTLKWLLPLKDPLRDVWDEKKYLMNAKKKKKPHRPAAPEPEPGPAGDADDAVRGRQEEERRAEANNNNNIYIYIYIKKKRNNNTYIYI